MKKIRQIFKNKTTIGIGCIVIAIVFAFLSSNINIGTKSSNIIKINRNLKAGEMIKSEYLEEIKVSASLPKNIVVDTDKIIDKYLSVDMVKDDYFTDEKISDKALYGSEYLKNLKEGEMAISLTIKNLAIGVSNQIESGDVVSIINIEQSRDEEKGDIVNTYIPEELKYIEVISVTNDSGNNTSTTSEEEEEVATTVTLLVNKRQATMIAELDLLGNVHLSLVYRGNDGNKKDLLKKQKDLFVNETKIETEDISEVTTEGVK